MNKLKSIGIFGHKGRMGKILQELIAKELPHLKIHTESEEDPSVWIDFSSPAGTHELIQKCIMKQIPLICGTTGIEEQTIKLFSKLGEVAPCLRSANMSFGIQIVKNMIKNFATLQKADFQIEEFHHTHKKDSPSGTAKELQSVLLQNVKSPERVPNPIGIRGGGIFGVHKVWAMMEEEVILVEHQALNRGVFAKGAIWAALNIVDLKPGVYTYGDLIELHSGS